MRKKRKKPIRTGVKAKANGKEKWVSLCGYEPAYQLKVSSNGRIVLLPELISDENGRQFAKICGRQIPVDLLVADGFVVNRTQSEQPWHINGDLTDNRAVNLRWVDYTKDPSCPGRMYSTLSLLNYILNPSLLADRDKEFSKFYTYLEYLWKTGSMPDSQEQMIMDGYDKHRKRVTEDYMRRRELNPSRAGNMKLPYSLPPDPIMARALTDTYERMTTSGVQGIRVRCHGWGNLAPIPYLLTPAMLRTINFGEVKPRMGTRSMALGYVDITSKDSGLVYRAKYVNPASMLKDSMTAPYHLNMLPQLPPLKSEKRAMPSQHLQSLIYTLREKGELPGWASDTITETLLEMLHDEMSYNRRDRHGVKLRSDAVRKWIDDRRTSLETAVTDGLEKMIADEVAAKGKTNVRFAEAFSSIYGRRADPPEAAGGTSDARDTSGNGNDGDKRNGDLATGRRADGSQAGHPAMPAERISPVSRDASGHDTDAVTAVNRESGDADGGIPDGNPEDPSQGRYDDGEWYGPSESPAEPDGWSWDDGYADAVITKVTRMRNPDDEAGMTAAGADDGISGAGHDEDGTYPGDGIAEDILDIPADDTVAPAGGCRPGTEEHRRAYPRSYTPEGVYIGNNRNPTSAYNRDVHPDRVHVVSDDTIRAMHLGAMINSEPEYDREGRPLRDRYYRYIRWPDAEIPLASPSTDTRGAGFQSSGEAQRAVDAFVRLVDLERRKREGDGAGLPPEEVSPLYDPTKDITLGMINSNAGLEESSYYNQLGQKVYHNVRYGERYDPEIHTLYIPEVQAFPSPFSAQARKRNWLDDYVRYLKKHYPEIEDPEILRKYYQTALAVKRIQREVLPNCPKNELLRRGRKQVPVRCVLPDGECMVFDSISQASEATGVNAEMIRRCATGRKEQAYGLRWELVDMADMDLMINRYLKDVIAVVEQCGMDVDWEEYLDSGVIRRMDDTIRYRRRSSYARTDDIRDVLYPDERTHERNLEKWKERKARKWELLKAVKAEDLGDRAWSPRREPGMRNPEFDFERGVPGNPGMPDTGCRDLDGAFEPDPDYDRVMTISDTERELKEREERVAEDERQIRNMKERLRAQSLRMTDLKREMLGKEAEAERAVKAAERAVEDRNERLRAVTASVRGRLGDLLDDLLPSDDGDADDGRPSGGDAAAESDDEKLARLLADEHNAASHADDGSVRHGRGRKGKRPEESGGE